MQITLDVWEASASYVPQKIRAPGICKVNLPLLRVIYAMSTIEPSVVQNPLTSAASYGKELRRYCAKQLIQYQGFRVLAGNRTILESEPVRNLARFGAVACVASPAILCARARRLQNRLIHLFLTQLL